MKITFASFEPTQRIIKFIVTSESNTELLAQSTLMRLLEFKDNFFLPAGDDQHPNLSVFAMRFYDTIEENFLENLTTQRDIFIAAGISEDQFNALIAHTQQQITAEKAFAEHFPDEHQAILQSNPMAIISWHDFNTLATQHYGALNSTKAELMSLIKTGNVEGLKASQFNMNLLWSRQMLDSQSRSLAYWARRKNNPAMIEHLTTTATNNFTTAKTHALLPNNDPNFNRVHLAILLEADEDKVINIINEICLAWTNGLTATYKGNIAPIHLAAFEGRANILRHIAPQLIPESVNARATEDDSTALHFAAENNHEDCVDALCKNGFIDVNATRVDGSTPLLIALEHKFKNITIKLISANADLYAKKQDGTTALSIIMDDNKTTLPTRTDFLKALCPTRAATLKQLYDLKIQVDDPKWNKLGINRFFQPKIPRHIKHLRKILAYFVLTSNVAAIDKVLEQVNNEFKPIASKKYFTLRRGPVNDFYMDYKQILKDLQKTEPLQPQPAPLSHPSKRI